MEFDFPPHPDRLIKEKLRKTLPPKNVYMIHIWKLDLPYYLRGKLIYELGCFTLFDLLNYTASDLIKKLKIGPKRLFYIRLSLANFGLELSEETSFSISLQQKRLDANKQIIEEFKP